MLSSALIHLYPAIIRILTSIASSCQPDLFSRSYPSLSWHHPDSTVNRFPLSAGSFNPLLSIFILLSSGFYCQSLPAVSRIHPSALIHLYPAMHNPDSIVNHFQLSAGSFHPLSSISILPSSGFYRHSSPCQLVTFILRASNFLTGSFISFSSCSYIEPHICQTFDRKILSVKSHVHPERRGIILYLEYRIVCPFVRITGEGAGGANSDDWRESLALGVYSTLWSRDSYLSYLVSLEFRDRLEVKREGKLALTLNLQSVISSPYPEYPICLCHILALSGTSYLSYPDISVIFCPYQNL